MLYVIKYKTHSTTLRERHAALPPVTRKLREEDAVRAVTRAVTAWGYRGLTSG